MWGTRLTPLRHKLAKRITPELIRYGIMAVVLVGTEIAVFQLMLQVGLSYLLAVPFSMAVGIILNWYFSHKFVFKHRPHSKHKEFTLVLIASLIGVGLQLAVTAIMVEILRSTPLIGKLLAICVTFFWNFWFRKKYVFYKTTE